MEKCIGNIETTLSPELIAELKAKDARKKEEMWKVFEENLPVNAKEIVAEFRKLYALYDDGLIKWMANLFDPDICVCNELYGKSVCEHHALCGTAGFHYTHSARDNVGYLPVVEAMNSIFDFVSSSGLATDETVVEYFTEELGEKMMNFVKNLQDPDGYFYHPQWGKDNITDGRRGRDLERAIKLLNRYDKKPIYPTITDLVSEKASETTLIPDYLKTPEAFKKYLDSLNIDTRSYHAGNTIGAQFIQIKARGEEYVKILGEFLDSHQREDNGIWHEKTDYYGSNGVMKILGNYSAMKRAIPNPEKALRASVNAIVSSENPDSIVTVWNPWVSLRHLFDNIALFDSKERSDALRREFLMMAPEAIRITKEKTAKFKKPDGSFSYLQEYSTWTMQGAPCAVPRTVEGDMDAAVLGTNSMINTITMALGMTDFRIPLYGGYESALFIDIIKNRKPVRK